MKLTIVVHTYNEAENIENLIEKLIRLNLGAKIIIVDDNSPDKTGEIATRFAKKHKKIKVILREKKLGLGSAYKVGFAKALSEGAGLIVGMDADLSHDPEVIPEMLQRIEKSDVVIGSRYVKNGKVIGFEKWRSLLSLAAQLICRILLGLNIHDSTSAFRVYRRKVLEDVDFKSIKSEGYSFLIELIFRVEKKGFKISEIPIRFKVREKGPSKISQDEIFKAVGTARKLLAGSLLSR